METETIQKNGASPKSYTSRINKALNLFAYALLLGGMALTAVSCKKNSAGNDDQLSPNTLNVKWIITNLASRFASFEFSRDGNYIVITRVGNEQARVKSDAGLNLPSTLLQRAGAKKLSTRASSESNLSPLHFGTYKIQGNKILLSGFGVIDVISITEEEFAFSFTLTSTGEKEEFVANKAAEPITAGSRADKLCRTWEVTAVTIDENAFSQDEKAELIEIYGPNWKAELEKEIAEEQTGLIVFFSKAGTYLILYENEGEEEAGLSEWKWANKEETLIYYSWDNWTDDWTKNIVQVKELSDATLQIQEEEIVYHLSPAK